jgi:hypothetical protein
MTPLERKQFLAALGGRPAGFVFLEQFCEVVEAGGTPTLGALEYVSSAFRTLLKHGDEKNMTLGLSKFADALDLHKAQSNTPATMAQVEERIFAAYEYQKLAKTKPKGVAADNAADFYTNWTGKKTTGKTVKRWAREYKSEISFIHSIDDLGEWIAQMERRQKNKQR